MLFSTVLHTAWNMPFLYICMLNDISSLLLHKLCVEKQKIQIVRRPPETHATLHEAKTGTYFLLCARLINRKRIFITYRRTVLLHRVRHLVVLIAPSFGGKETVLTHIKIETFEASISESANWRGFANIAFGLMPGGFGGNKTM